MTTMSNSRVVRVMLLERPAIASSALPVVVVLLLLALAGCGGSESSDQTTYRDPTISEIPVGERAVVEDFDASLLDGSEVDATRLDGVVTVVNVWGSWCGPCRVEAPDLREVARQYADRGVEFLGLNVRDNDGAATAFEKRFKIPYASVGSADSPRVSLAFGGLLTTAAVPMTVVVDPQRRVAARVIGPVTAATLRALVDGVQAESSARTGP